MIKAYKYRLYPNKIQQVLLAKTFGSVRFYWNNLVQSFNSYDKEDNPSPTYLSQKELKVEFEWLGEVSAAALQQKARDFNKTKKQYFSKDRKKKLGRMQFKSKRNRQSFRLPNQKFKVFDNKIQLEKVGKVRYRSDRPLPENARLLSVTVSRNPAMQYFASIAFEIDRPLKEKKSDENVGIDLGISAIATLSNGIQFSNPRKFVENQDKLKRYQRHFSRKTKGSSRWHRQCIKVARVHQKTVNQRNWILNSIARFIVDNFDEIGMEDLNVSGMVKNHHLAKSVSDASMGKLKALIQQKQREYGKGVVLLNRFEPSTKECCLCGHTQPMKLSDRTFKCEICHNEIDRDLNASIVIRDKTVGVNAVQQTWSNSKSTLPLGVEWRLLGSVEIQSRNKILLDS